MTTSATIWCKTSFIGFHRWKEAPEAVEYLREWHRHKFNVTVWKDVIGLNRQIEFHLLKRDVDNYLIANFKDKQFEYSCEEIALKILNRFNASCVEVDEDGECGAYACTSRRAQ